MVAMTRRARWLLASATITVVLLGLWGSHSQQTADGIVGVARSGYLVGHGDGILLDERSRSDNGTSGARRKGFSADHAQDGRHTIGKRHVQQRMIEYNDFSPLNDKPLTWGDTVLVGQYLYSLINAGITCVQQGKWTNYADLETYGWSRLVNVNVKPSDLGPGYEAMWTEWGLPSGEGDTVKVAWKHRFKSQPTGSDHQVYQPTGARYMNTYNRVVIIADVSFGPDFEGKRQTPPIMGSGVVPLKQWTDITFLQWQDFCNNDPTRMQALRGIARASVINKKTQDIVNEALKNSNKALDSWPQRVTWDISQPEAHAILATPNGQGVGWFLAQHKQQLGWKTITAVTVLAGAAKTPLNVLFTIAAHPMSQKRRRELGFVHEVEMASKRRHLHELATPPFSKEPGPFGEALERGASLLRDVHGKTWWHESTYEKPAIDSESTDWRANITRAVSNDTSRVVVQEVLIRMHDDEEVQLRVSTTMAEGQALMGTEEGIASAWLLASAARERSISHVTIVETAENTVLCFHIRNAVYWT